MKKPIILFGGGGHCRSSIDVIEQENKFAIQGIVDIPDKIGEKIMGYTIIACDEDLLDLIQEYEYFFVTLGHLGNPTRRIQIFNLLKQLKVKIPTIISPLAYISKYSSINEGTIVMHNAIINAGAKIGRNCIINTKALIEHDVIIKDHCHISTGAIVNGGVVIGDRSFYGSSAVSKQNTIIPNDSFIKANSTIK